MLYKIKPLLILLIIMSIFLIVSCDKKNPVSNNYFNYEALYNTWQYSKSNNDTLIFVPEGYEQPSILPVQAFTFYRDNKFVEYSFGPADAPIEFTGIWEFSNKNHILINFDDGNQPYKPNDYEIEIIELKENMLKIIRTIL